MPGMSSGVERARSVADDAPALDTLRGAEILAHDVVAHAGILPISSSPTTPALSEGLTTLGRYDRGPRL
jgi:hypothetical protein